MDKILIIGGTGLLGKNTSFLLRDDFEIYIHGNKTKANFNFDARNFDSLYDTLKNHKFFGILNFAALTDVDFCQKNLKSAYEINTKIPENLVLYLKTISPTTKLINISSDQLYDKKNSRENDIRIINNYAMTKYAGELSVNTFPHSINLRTNFFGNTLKDSPKLSFSDWVISNLRLGEKINIFEDIYFSPISFLTFGKAMKTCLKSFSPGTYNLGSHEGMSKADFIRNIAKLLKLSTSSTKSINSVSLNGRSPRPKDMRMNCDLFEKTFTFSLPKLIDEIKFLKK